MNLKRFNDYISEKDQHRQRSEKDEVLDKEIEDVHSDEQEIPNEEEINNSDISVEDIAELAEVNEGAVKELSYEIQEILKKMMEEAVDSYLTGRNTFTINDISKKYTDKILELLSSNESLTEKEDVDEDIIDKAEEEMHEETEEDLKDETKKVFNTTSKIENELEELDEDKEDFTINPNGADFKLMKNYLGENTNYNELRSFLKETFPGWEDYTEDILETWGLIN